MKNADELQSAFSFELALFPTSLFDESGMCKGEKSTLYDCFTPCTDIPGGKHECHIIDGGFLLH